MLTNQSEARISGPENLRDLFFYYKFQHSQKMHPSNSSEYFLKVKRKGQTHTGNIITTLNIISYLINVKHVLYKGFTTFITFTDSTTC